MLDHLPPGAVGFGIEVFIATVIAIAIDLIFV
jgi:hypothetical protein